jgi:hypothetical protein
MVSLPRQSHENLPGGSEDPLYLKPPTPLGCFCPSYLGCLSKQLGFHVHKSKPICFPWLPLFSTVKNLVAMITMVRKQCKPIIEQGSPNNFEPQSF